MNFRISQQNLSCCFVILSSLCYYFISFLFFYFLSYSFHSSICLIPYLAVFKICYFKKMICRIPDSCDPIILFSTVPCVVNWIALLHNQHTMPPENITYNSWKSISEPNWFSFSLLISYDTSNSTTIRCWHSILFVF